MSEPADRSMIHYGVDPFAVAEEDRDPARRLRGRLVSPVTAWTAWDEDGEASGITVSSLTVVEGQPASIVGVIDPLSAFWTAVAHSRRFIVHVLERDRRRLSDQLAGKYPGPDARFENVELLHSDWGPVIADVGTQAKCTFVGFHEVGDALLVHGHVDELAISDIAEPLVYFRGAYYDLRPR